MLHAADAAHLLAAAGATGSAMDQDGQGRTVAGRFLGAVAIDDGDASVIGAGVTNNLARNFGVMREQRHDQRAAAAIAKVDGIIEIFVRHER